MHGENGFDFEFNHIERKTERDLYYGDFKTAIHPINHSKNRYSNVLPFEKTRVVLAASGPDGSDYINASYVSGETPGSERAYICTQGPMKNTCNDFWQMVWEQNTSTIVMLTKEEENKKPKCTRYWPDEGLTALYGKIAVTFVKMDNQHELVVRYFKIEHSVERTARQVVQFQYVSWPDHGLPVSTTVFLELIRMFEKQPKTGPAVIHCSAGIGRSGTFCTVHSTITKYKHDLATKPEDPPAFNIMHTVIFMRAQRPGMVQTKEQYMFCYLSIDEESAFLGKKAGGLGRNSIAYSH